MPVRIRHTMRMRTPLLFIAGLSSALLLTGCWGQTGNGGASSSSLSSLSSSSEEASSSVPSSVSGEFTLQPDGDYLGSVTLTGYVTKREVGEPFCDRDCATYTYVFFNITDGVTPPLQDFLDRNEGNSYAGPGMIGLGCVSEDGKTIRSEVADPDSYMASREIGRGDSDVILNSNPRNLVTITLNRDYAPAGGEAPACYSHFEYVMVTE